MTIQRVSSRAGGIGGGRVPPGLGYGGEGCGGEREKVVIVTVLVGVKVFVGVIV